MLNGNALSLAQTVANAIQDYTDSVEARLSALENDVSAAPVPADGPSPAVEVPTPGPVEVPAPADVPPLAAVPELPTEPPALGPQPVESVPVLNAVTQADIEAELEQAKADLAQAAEDEASEVAAPSDPAATVPGV